MQINITARHIELDDSIKKYITKKLSKLEKYTNKIIDVEVILEIQKFRNIAELIVNMKDKNMVVKEEAENFNAAFDIALDTMQKRVKRYWDKRKDHNKK